MGNGEIYIVWSRVVNIFLGLKGENKAKCVSWFLWTLSTLKPKCTSLRQQLLFSRAGPPAFC